MAACSGAKAKSSPIVSRAVGSQVKAQIAKNRPPALVNLVDRDEP
jgi:hypothetical protein